MQDSKLLKELVSCNRWANETLLDQCKELSDEVVTSTTIGSFPSIMDTWYHIMDAEMVWLNRMQGVVLSSFPSVKMNKSWDHIQQALPQYSRQFETFVHEQRASFFNESFSYTNTKGKEFSTPYRDMILQVTHHGMYHRGQIVNYMRQLSNVKPVQTDYILYKRLFP